MIGYLPVSLHDIIQSALRDWKRRSFEISELQHLLCFRNQCMARPDLPQAAIASQLLSDMLARLETRNREYAEVLSLRFQHGHSILAVGRRLDMSESNVHRKQREAIELFVLLFREEEERERRCRRDRFIERLPIPPEASLFGTDAVLDYLYGKISDVDGPLLLSIEGMGGIGKTTAADALMRRAIDHDRFEDYGWVSAQVKAWYPNARLGTAEVAVNSTLDLLEALIVQLIGSEALPSPFTIETGEARLARHLRGSSSLIVVDNLETMADLNKLLPIIRNLAGPTRFVLTSRQSLQPLANVFPLRLRPLGEQDSLSLVRYWAERSNLSDIATADDAQLRPIFETVGGNPLVLRLVVGQAQYYDLYRVLDSMRTASGTAADQIYTYIYRQVWDNLAINDRKLLLATPLLPKEGGELSYLAAVSGLNAGEVHDALENLIRCSLVDHRRNGLGDSRYTIHSLTRTFLLDHEIRWGQESAPAT